jgi:hypothetical protein
VISSRSASYTTINLNYSLLILLLQLSVSPLTCRIPTLTMSSPPRAMQIHCSDHEFFTPLREILLSDSPTCSVTFSHRYITHCKSVVYKFSKDLGSLQNSKRQHGTLKEAINKYVLDKSHNTTLLLINGTLWYQLHVSATILAIVRLYSNLLR